MTQISQPWDGIVAGDATRAPYNESEWDDMFEDMFNSDVDRGVLADRGNALVGSIPGANTFRIASGAALVKGKWYRNDANVDFAVVSSTAPGQWRRDRIVLSSTWDNINSPATRDPAVQVAQTIRLIHMINPNENGAAPAMTKTDGTLWEISLYRIEVDDVGAVTIYLDDREGACPSVTRQFFVPCTNGWNITDGTIISEEDDRRGLVLPDLKVCYRAGYTMVPSNFLSGMTITAVVVPAANGNVYSNNGVFYGACAESYSTHNESSGYAAVPLVGATGTHNCIQPVALPDAALGDILHLWYYRDAVDALDTIGDVCYVSGWIVAYKARY